MGARENELANFDTLFTFFMNNEDKTQAHAVVPDAPPCAWAISGINSAAFPQQFKAIAAIPQAQRGPAVENFYQTEFFNKWEAQLSDPVAERILDAMVNNGPVTGTKILQEAVNSLGPCLVVDGQWGPATVAAANACDQGELVVAIKNTRVAYYEAIVARNPQDAQYEAAWLARARE